MIGKKTGGRQLGSRNKRTVAIEAKLRGVAKASPAAIVGEQKLGRPSLYSAELAQAVCARLSEGMTLRQVCRDEQMPAESTVRGWALDDRDGFSAHYARAREIGYHAMADETLEIADDAAGDYVVIDIAEGVAARNFDAEHVSRARLRVDTRKWLLSKALPKIYGDRAQVELTGKDGGPVETRSVSARELVERRIAQLAERGPSSGDLPKPE